MRAIRLGKSDVSSSIIGLGCMGMSEFYGARDDTESLRTLERAFELGVTHFDTSNVYGRGHNEELLGRFAQGKRDRISIASKFGIVRDPDGPDNSAYDRGIDNSPTYIRTCCEESLSRLMTDTIDLYYIHRLDAKVPVEESVGELSRLICEGKIRAIGLSEVSADQLQRAHAIHPIAALQSEYSLWTREVEHTILPLCRKLDISFVAYSPLGRGFLTGAIQNAAELADDDFRRTSPRFQGENFDRNRVLVDRVCELANKNGCTAGQIALSWLFHRNQDVVPIPGTKRVHYLEENVAATEIVLGEADLKHLEEILPPGGAAGARYEEGFAGHSKKEDA